MVRRVEGSGGRSATLKRARYVRIYETIYGYATKLRNEAGRFSVVARATEVSQMLSRIFSDIQCVRCAARSRRVLAVLIKFHRELHDRTELTGRADKNESRRSIDSPSNDRIASFSFIRIETRFSKDSAGSTLEKSSFPRNSANPDRIEEHAPRGRLNIYLASIRSFDDTVRFPTILLDRLRDPLPT